MTTSAVHKTDLTTGSRCVEDRLDASHLRVFVWYIPLHVTDPATLMSD
jgi:hypothetical protein